MSVIVLLHLYPRELGINGDVGNILALRRRAQWRGMPVEVHEHEVGAQLPARAHLVHIGSGPRSGQEAVHADLDRIAAQLRQWRDDDVPFLAIAGGWQLLGRELIDAGGTTRAGADVLPTRATLSGRRSVGEVLASSTFGAIAGYENHGSVVELLDGAAPLAQVTHRDGPGPTAEGVMAGPSIGTNLHGPLLPMNPAIADHLLAAAAALAGVSLGPDDPRIQLVDDRAARARDAIQRRLAGRPAQPPR